MKLLFAFSEFSLLAANRSFTGADNAPLLAMIPPVAPLLLCINELILLFGATDSNRRYTQLTQVHRYTYIVPCGIYDNMLPTDREMIISRRLAVDSASEDGGAMA
jgi:hypothetical protein